jgi:hypothetical protein
VTHSDAKIATVTVQNRAEPPVAGVEFSAKSKGTWGNFLFITIEDGSTDPNNEFRISVRRQTEVEVVPEDFAAVAPLEIHDNLSMDPAAPNFVTDVLDKHSTLISAKVAAENKSLQRGLHRGGTQPVLPLGDRREFLINVDNDGFQQAVLPDTISDSRDLAEVAGAIQAAVQGLGATKKKDSTPIEAFNDFTCTAEGADETTHLLLKSGTTREQSSVLVQNAPDPGRNATAQLRLGAGHGGVSESGLAVRRPGNAPSIQLGDNAVGGLVTAVSPGSDGTGEMPVRSFTDAFKHLDNKTDFSLLAVPGENVPPLVDAAMAYCENRPLRDVFYIGETTEDDDQSDAEAFRKQLTKPNSYGALYFPWIKALDPSGVSAEPVLLPPSGYIAGLYARTDANRGVWKAPAGTEASLSGAVGLGVELSDVEHGNLNPLGVNVIRRFATAGIVSFGARTVSSDPEWKYVPVRRMAIMLRVSIYYGIQWAVFEPNDEPLWSQLRLNVRSFMLSLFRQGAFQGATPSQAFFVKCDAETTTQADIDLGIVNVLVGFAPLKPAEFVVVKISQKAGQAA